MRKRFVDQVVAISLLLCLIFGLIPGMGTVADNEQPGLDVSNGLFFHFIPLHQDGDCCIVCFGSKQILIDCGATSISVDSVIKEMKLVMPAKDQTWDYVIVSHGDADHISGLPDVVQEMKKAGYRFGTLIDFCEERDTEVYREYAKLRDGKSFTDHKYAKDLCGPKHSEYKISLGTINGQKCQMTILYNYYYDHGYDVDSDSGFVKAARDNLPSVCVLFTFGSESFLFTGDLPEYISSQYGKIETETGLGPEDYLIQHNPSLKKIADAHSLTMIKVPHHGSITSSSEAFVKALCPRYAVITAVADSKKNEFPSQSIVERYASVSSNILITEHTNEKRDSTEPCYGDIVIFSDGALTTAYSSDCYIQGTEHTIKSKVYGTPLPLGETEWFIQNRQTLQVIMLDADVYGTGHCTLLKYGFTEILIDCGINARDVSDINKMVYPEKLKEYCKDGILEYVIVTHAQTESLSNLIGTYRSNEPQKDGVFDLFTIKNLFTFANTNIDPSEGSWLTHFYEQAESQHIRKFPSGIYAEPITEHFNLNIVSPKDKHYQKEDNYSLWVYVDFYGARLLFTGDMTNEENAEHELLTFFEGKEGVDLHHITFFRAGNDGGATSNSQELIDVLQPEYVVIPGTLGLTLDGRTYPSLPVCQRLLAAAGKTDGRRNVYAMSQIVAGQKQPVCGDITFTIRVRDRKVIEKEISGSAGVIPLNKTQWYKNQTK